MEYTEESLKKWIKEKENKQSVIEEICEGCEAPESRVAIFMAGSPGAGKTEVANRLKKENDSDIKFAHIDQDRIKSLLPGYSGELAEKYHGAASLGVDIVFSYILKQKYNFIMDSTFSNFERGKKNIERCLKREYDVKLYFVYQDPSSAWNFVQQRQKREGRVVPVEAFARQFVSSRKVVNDIKKEFGENIKLTLIIKPVDIDDVMKDKKFEIDIDNIDKYLDKTYNSEKGVYEEINSKT